MQYDAIWQAFADTGDPLYYLLYKTAEDGWRRQEEEREASPLSGS